MISVENKTKQASALYDTKRLLIISRSMVMKLPDQQKKNESIHIL